MHVLVHVVDQLAQTGIECTPSRAGVRGEVQTVSQGFEPCDAFAVLVVFKAHPADRCGDHRMTAMQHQRKEDLLFLGHVLVERDRELLERRLQARRHLRVRHVTRLDACGQPHELRQFASVGFVVARQDVFDQRRCLLRRFGARHCQSREFRLDDVDRD